MAIGVGGYAAITAAHNGTDFEEHASFASRWLTTGLPYTPHVVFAGLTIIAHALAPSLTFLDAGFVVAAVAYGVLAVVLLQAMNLAPNGLAQKLLLTTGLIVAAPIFLATWKIPNLYLGYLSTSTYHNPTQLLLKPSALALFLICARGFTSTRASGLQVLGTSILAVVSVATKPNFAICLLPSLVVVGAIQWQRKRPLDLRLLLLGIAIPTVLALGAEYVGLRTLAYTTTKVGATGFTFQPFAFYRTILTLEGKPQLLAIKFIASVAFPAAVGLVLIRKVLNEVDLLLAWSGFAIGAVYSYLLAERGTDLLAGNFTWSGQITLFVLFCASALVLARQRQNWITAACWAVLGLHVACGLYWFAFHGRAMW